MLEHRDTRFDVLKVYVRLLDVLYKPLRSSKGFVTMVDILYTENAFIGLYTFVLAT